MRRPRDEFTHQEVTGEAFVRNRNFKDALVGVTGKINEQLESVNVKKESQSEKARRTEELLTFKWSTQWIDDSWLKRSVVGILKQFSNISSVNNRLFCRGFQFS